MSSHGLATGFALSNTDLITQKEAGDPTAIAQYDELANAQVVELQRLGVVGTIAEIRVTFDADVLLALI